MPDKQDTAIWLLREAISEVQGVISNFQQTFRGTGRGPKRDPGTAFSDYLSQVHKKKPMLIPCISGRPVFRAGFTIRPKTCLKGIKFRIWLKTSWVKKKFFTRSPLQPGHLTSTFAELFTRKLFITILTTLFC